MQEKFKTFVNKLNRYGIPLPLFRDNKTGVGSISLTMMIISFLTVFVGLIGKWSNYLDVNLEQSLYWFYGCAALYFGRTVGGVNKTTVNKDNSSNE